MKAIHKKTQEVYYIKDVATNTTNSQDGQIMVIYYNGRGQMFAREQFEFFEKFDIGVDHKSDLLDTCIRAIADENRHYREEKSDKSSPLPKMAMSKDTESAFNIANLPSNDNISIEEAINIIDKIAESYKDRKSLTEYNQAEYFNKFSEESIQTCFIKEISPKTVQSCFDKIIARKDQPSLDSYSELKIELARKKISEDSYLYYHFLLCYNSTSKGMPTYIERVYQLPTQVGQELIKRVRKVVEYVE